MENRFNSYSLKSGNIELKDVDTEGRKVALYLSKFDVMDSDMDVIKKGSFKKSILERGPKSESNRKIAYLRHHNWEWQIGKFVELTEDEVGLFAVGQLSNSTQGNDAFEDYKDGIIREHSIGFKYVSDKMRFVEDEKMPIGGYYEITEVALWEGSAVTFGANEYTEVVDVMKSEHKIELAKKLHDEIETIVKSLKNGQGTDDRLYSLEMRLKYLNGRMLELASYESQNEKHSKATEPHVHAPSFDWNKVINKL